MKRGSHQGDVASTALVCQSIHASTCSFCLAAAVTMLALACVGRDGFQNAGARKGTDPPATHDGGGQQADANPGDAALGDAGMGDGPSGDTSTGGDGSGGDAQTGDPYGNYDPTGTYALVSGTPTYSCAFGLVNFNITEMIFADDGAGLQVTAAPCVMSGPSAAASGSIDVTCTLVGTCDEIYALAGSFTDADNWTGTFSATFTGPVCADCTTQAWSVAGQR